MKRSPSQAPSIGLALSGGGPMGAIYEVGALCALQESLNGVDFTKLQHYVGVSAGGFLVAGLANGISPRALCASFIENDSGPSETFDPSWLTEPAYGEMARRAIMWPGLLLGALQHLLLGRKSLAHALESLGPGLPSGIFANDQVHVQLERLFSRAGRTNDFRQLKTQLTLVATNLDSGETAPFGRPGWDHVPISKAVQASSALPGLFPPVEIDDAYYVDGALNKTMHASVALDQGVDLMLCLNPLVPFDASAPHHSPHHSPHAWPHTSRIPRIIDGGLPAVLSQTFRAMIHSRMVLGIKQYERLYPQADIILIEPDQRDPELYLANTFSYAQRRHLAEHAYQQTRHLLRSRTAGLSAKLWRHGITLHHEALDDPTRHLCPPPVAPSRMGRALSRLEGVMEELSHTLSSLAHQHQNQHLAQPRPERSPW